MNLIQEPLEKYLEKYNADATPIRDLMRIVKLAPDRVWIAGGAARKLYSNLPISSGDIDVVFQKGATLHRRIDALEKRYEEVSHYTDMSSSFVRPPVKIQLLHRLERDVASIFNYFDLSVCHFALDGTSMFFTEQAAQDCANGVFNVKLRRKMRLYAEWKEFGRHNATTSADSIPDASSYRLFKYLFMGFVPEQEEVKKVMHMDLARILGYGVAGFPNKPLSKTNQNAIIKRLTVGPGSHS